MTDEERLKKLLALREAVRPLIEGLYRIPKDQRYWLRLDNPVIEALGKAFKEADAT